MASSKTLRLPLISRGSPSFLCTIFPRLQYFHLQNCRWVKNCLQYLLQFSSVHPMSVHVCPVPPQHFKQGKYFPRPVLTVHTLSLFKHLKGQLGSPFSDKKSSLPVSKKPTWVTDDRRQRTDGGKRTTDDNSGQVQSEA